MRIIPLRDLKDTSAISAQCKEAKEPIFVTKNGYGDMVIMSIETYEEQLARADIYTKLADAEMQVSQGKMHNAMDSLAKLRAKHEV